MLRKNLETDWQQGYGVVSFGRKDLPMVLGTFGIKKSTAALGA
jgi:hypothetical protein